MAMLTFWEGGWLLGHVLEHWPNSASEKASLAFIAVESHQNMYKDTKNASLSKRKSHSPCLSQQDDLSESARKHPLISTCRASLARGRSDYESASTTRFQSHQVRTSTSLSLSRDILHGKVDEFRWNYWQI
jgi:hypothetical protein